MAFGDDLVEASLGGVPFWVEDSLDLQVGRRTVVTQIAGSDLVAHEDLGALARAHEVKALVVGDDAVSQAKRLLAVFDKPGPYDYAHRTEGPRQVVLSPGSRPRMVYTEGRRRAISVSFSLVEVTTRASLASAPSSAGQIKKAGAALSLAAAKQWAEKAKKGGATFDAVVAAINKIANELRKVKRKALGPLAVVDQLDAAIDDLQAAAGQLAGVPADLAAGLAAILAELYAAMALFSGEGTAERFAGQGASVKTEAALAALVDVAEVELVEGDDSADAQSDQKQLEILLTSLALASCADLFITVAPTSADQVAFAVEAAGDVADELLTLPEVDIDLHLASRDARDALLVRLSEAAGQLREVRVFRPAASMPAVVIAWNLTGDPQLASDLVGRNRIKDPAFIVDEIEVILER